MAAPVSPDRLPPTTSAYVIATAIIAGVTGYFIGQGASLGLFREKQGWPNGYDVKVHKGSSDEEDDEEEESDDDEGNGEELASFKDNLDEVKLVLVVRTDLGMTKGMYTDTLHFSRSTRVKLKVDANVCSGQEKSPPKLPTPRSRATNISSYTRPTHPFCAGGNGMARPRSRCRSSRRMSCCSFRRRL